ncbi:tetratricopeptide repeat protein [Novosphingobium mangrovi (ex Huang et al. 2023)]|uniref:Tetratricopeptide repeat protein n=1 Tax=Novosphingobium mangrovi (ex Huang et al. 2023) TaxID=2976432 RepID=A0ABT2I1I1_9SPHN|nr:hypothetical protein [Novosphingobium mangrovi (ex Huang et al. 2023)]MCT2398651.1 hypothetical protein [Novosphingobium mangrovi (ex Huang et al. 2023)]
MTRSLHADLAERYFLEDLPGAAQLGARLNGILLKIDAGEPVTALQRQFLVTTGLRALDALAEGQATLEEFQAAAQREQAARIEDASVKALKDAAELAERAEARAAAVKATFAAMANDPALRRKREAKELRQRFGVGYIESDDYPRVMALLRQVANGQRLKVDDLAWLKTEADYCWTDELQRAWHALEAAALTKAWESSGDPWNAVNASGHWRKAGEPERALRLTEAALAKVGSNPKLRSALATTRGGAMRDLRRLDEAKTLASEAHELTSSDYRPCTLLGAVYIELGDLPTGHEWYAKAESLGAPRQAIDHELRGLLMRSSNQEQQRIREYLLRQDPERFAWLRRWPGNGQSSAHSKSAQTMSRKYRTAFVEAGRHDHSSR